MDPKYDLENENVIVKECSALFGGSNKFKTKSLYLKLQNKVIAEDIYWRVFGTRKVANNEIPTWIIHGFIAQGKGYEINWAKATKSATKKSSHGLNDSWATILN